MKWMAAALILCAGVLLWFKQQKSADVDAVALPQQTAQALAKPEKTKSAMPPVTLAPAQAIATKAVPPVAATGSAPDFSKYPYKIENPKLVEFRVAEQGYAIAYGDIVLGKVKPDMKETKALFEPPPSKLWESGRIPYAIDPQLKNTQFIEQAIQYFARETPIQLVPVSDEKDLIVFVPSEKECASVLGRVGGQQPILVGPECGFTEMLHEIMHALGFVHEHSRLDRDQHIKVVWDNIQPEYFMQFHMVPDGFVHSYQGSVFDFDYDSIMLYPKEAFAKSHGLVTLQTLSNRQLNPARNALSQVDKERLFYLYSN